MGHPAPGSLIFLDSFWPLNPCNVIKEMVAVMEACGKDGSDSLNLIKYPAQEDTLLKKIKKDWQESREQQIKIAEAVTQIWGKGEPLF